MAEHAIRYIDILEGYVKSHIETGDPELVARMFVEAAGVAEANCELTNPQERPRLLACISRLDTWLLAHARTLGSPIEHVELLMGPRGEQVMLDELNEEQHALATQLLQADDIWQVAIMKGRTRLISRFTTRWRLLRQRLAVLQPDNE